MTPYTVHLHRFLLVGIVAILVLVPAGFGHLVHRSDADDDSLDCRPVAFVRAADLVPNSVVPGEARLVMHGTGCRNGQNGRSA
jgi:membrane protein YdbS with pleckstrin-like domain